MKMKTKYFMMVCIAMLTMGTIQAPAQGLGGLLKKGKKALEKVNNALGGTTENNKQDAKTETLQTRGGDIALLNGGSREILYHRSSTCSSSAYTARAHH